MDQLRDLNNILVQNLQFTQLRFLYFTEKYTNFICSILFHLHWKAITEI